MPHSINASPGPIPTYPSDFLDPSPSNLNTQGVLPPFGKTASSPVATKRHTFGGSDVHSEATGVVDTGDVRPKSRGDRSSMLASYNDASKQRAHYYEEQFQYKDNVSGSARERVTRESPVIADLKTNVIIKDEFTLVTDLSYHLAARYTRPDSAIMVKVDHSACLALGGTFDPCYVLEVTAVSSQMGPTVNKRNAALIQTFMAEILSVPPERGIVKFCSIAEDNLATNSSTVLGEIERQEKQQPNDNNGAVRSIMSSSKRSIPSFKKSMHRLNVMRQAAEEDEESRQADNKTNDAREKRLSMKTELRQALMNAQQEDEATTLSISEPSRTLSTRSEVYELPAEDMNKGVAEIVRSETTSNELNGLRMNGISDAMSERASEDASTPNERPKTLSPETISDAKKALRKDKSSASRRASIRKSQISAPLEKSEQAQSFLMQDPAGNITHTVSVPIRQNRRNSRTSLGADRPRSRDSYSSGPADIPNIPRDRARKASDKPSTIVEEAGPRMAGKETDEADEKGDTRPNTAKRRSTIVYTALPRLEPPPVPDKQDTRSMRSLKMGKRKSLLSVFRRSAGAKTTS